jgi:serine/threonine protein kinase
MHIERALRWLQHFIQKAMHLNPACRGTAKDLLNHQWILHHMGKEVAPHWAPPEPAFAQSQIPGPPQKNSNVPVVSVKAQPYKHAPGKGSGAAMPAVGAPEDVLLKTATWDPAATAAPSVSRPDVKVKLDRQVSGLRTSRRPATGEASMMSADSSNGQSSMV